MLVGFLVPVVLLLLLSTVFGWWWLNLIVGILLGIAVAVWVFTRRLQKGVYEQIEGEAGAAAWALTNLRDGVGMKWIVEPGIARTRTWMRSTASSAPRASSWSVRAIRTA